MPRSTLDLDLRHDKSAAGPARAPSRPQLVPISIPTTRGFRKLVYRRKLTPPPSPPPTPVVPVSNPSSPPPRPQVFTPTPAFKPATPSLQETPAPTVQAPPPVLPTPTLQAPTPTVTTPSPVLPSPVTPEKPTVAIDYSLVCDQYVSASSSVPVRVRTGEFMQVCKKLTNVLGSDSAASQARLLPELRQWVMQDQGQDQFQFNRHILALMLDTSLVRVLFPQDQGMGVIVQQQEFSKVDTLVKFIEAVLAGAPRRPEYEQALHGHLFKKYPFLRLGAKFPDSLDSIEVKFSVSVICFYVSLLSLSNDTGYLWAWAGTILQSSPTQGSLLKLYCLIAIHKIGASPLRRTYGESVASGLLSGMRQWGSSLLQSDGGIIQGCAKILVAMK